jgi:hypothetical protein
MASSRAIPITAIHELYENLRKSNIVSHHEAKAKEYLSNPEKLVAACRDSQAHFASYRNVDEGLLAQPREIDIEKANRNFRVFTENCGITTGWDILHGMQSQQEFTFENYPQVGFRYKEYDVRGRRTTQSCYEDGRQADKSGTGGMDAFLMTSDAMPAVAEFKAPKDTDFFLCLIQALMYAVEQSTANQYERIVEWLLKDYRLSLPNRQSPPYVDAYLIVVEQKPRLFDITQELICKLYDSHPNIGEVVRRIVCLRAAAENGELKLTLCFAFGQDIRVRL